MSRDELYGKRRKLFTDEQREKHARLVAHARGVRADRKARYKVERGELSESRLQLAVVAAAHRLGYIVVKLRASGRRGVPDLLLIAPGGYVFFMELKVPGGRLSPSQALFIRKLEKHGAIVAVCWSFVEAIAILQEGLRNEPT